jgi:cobalt-precorrin-5B (C1)-methyltransferase
VPIAARVAALAHATAMAALRGAPVAVEVLVVDRDGAVAGEAHG